MVGWSLPIDTQRSEPEVTCDVTCASDPTIISAYSQPAACSNYYTPNFHITPPTTDHFLLLSLILYVFPFELL